MLYKQVITIKHCDGFTQCYEILRKSIVKYKTAKRHKPLPKCHLQITAAPVRVMTI